MDYFAYQPDRIFCEGVALDKIAADVGTPTFVYSQTLIRRLCERFSGAFAAYPTSICYAVKANGNLSVLRNMAEKHLGADVVSLGELQRCLLSGIAAKNIVFSGIGKQEPEIRKALAAGIMFF